MVQSASFHLPNPQPDDLARQVRSIAGKLGGSASGGVVFLCGSPARQAADMAAALESACEAPLLLGCGSGVIDHNGEHEKVSAAVGLLWRGGACVPLSCDLREHEGRSAGMRVARELASVMRGRGGTAILLAHPDSFPANAIISPWPGSELHLFGGGVVDRPGAFVVHEGTHRTADVVGLALWGLPPPLIRATVACRLLSDLKPVTQFEDGMVLRIGDRAALTELKAQASNAGRGSLVLVAIAVGADASHRPRLLVRGVRGVDDDKGGLLLGDEVAEGTYLAFAVRDASAARSDMEATLRDMGRDLAGAMPTLGFYIDSAGRGSDLYGVGNVDVGLIRKRWPTMPFIGMKSAFELGPTGPSAAVHMYSGILSLFCSPS